MTVEVIRDALLWCFIINAGVLLFWEVMHSGIKLAFALMACPARRCAFPRPPGD